MPASLLTELNSNGGGLEDQRALQLALELTMLGIGNGNTTDEVDGSGSYSPTMSNFEDFNKLGRKSSANMTECVPVPSSEHVAEIVGRQGCKIKALRAKTNTYIKTPVRGEEPVFVVTGRKEDVCAAKREILSAADHFSQIRASRRNNANGLAPGPPNPSAPGQVTIQVRVPYRVVGLVVGPKGATIKRIQQQTHTYIVTPSRDKEPIFEVTGLPENVEKSRQQIEAHIAMRTGGLMDSKTIDEFNDFHSNGIDTGLDMNSDFINGGFFKGLSSNSAFSSYNALNTLNSNNLLNQLHQDNIFSFPSMNSSKISDYSSISTTGFSNGFSIYDSDEGFASPTFAQSTLGSSVWTDATLDNSNVTIFGSTSTTTSLPERSSSLGDTPCITPPLTETTNHPTVRRLSSDPINGGISAYTSLPNCAFIPTSACSSLGGSSISTSPTSSTGSSHSHYACIMCPDPSSASTFMPCGQHRLCVECANLMIKKPESDRRCPICN